MHRMPAGVKTLRSDRGFNGYIHLKAIPGASARLIEEAGYYADRMSVNIELPSEESLNLLAPDKSRKTVFGPIALIDDISLSSRVEKALPATYTIDEAVPDMVRDVPVPYRPSRQRQPFVPAGQSTQIIVGASPEPDSRIIRLAEGLYRRFGLKRAKYFITCTGRVLEPIPDDPLVFRAILSDSPALQLQEPVRQLELPF